MKFDDMTRFQIGALTVLVACVGGYAVYQAVSPAQAPAVQAPPASTPEQPQSAPASSTPGRPTLTLQGETSVPGGTGGHEVRASAGESLNYSWTIQGGKFESGNDGPSVTWTADKSGVALITCKATRPGTGEESAATLRVTIQAGPSIGRFEALPPVVTAGSNCRLIWTVQDATQVSLDPGAQDFSANAASGIDLKPTETTTYTLKASNKTGQSVSRELTIKVVPVPKISSLRAEAVPGSPNTFRITANFSGGKAELKQGETVIGSSEASPMTVQVSDLKGGDALQFVVTNEAGAYIASTLTISKP